MSKYALLLGNSVYQDARFPPLKAPEADINSFADVLRDPAIGAFDDVRVLLNTPSNDVRRAIGRFFRERVSEDLLLLYFSGHGVLDEAGHLYLAFSDAEHDEISGTAIHAADITRWMDNSNSRRMIWILDCCHSGAFKRGAKAMPGESVGMDPFKGDGVGRAVLTASTATQFAWEGDRILAGPVQNSLFTHFMVEGLRTGEADIGGDGEITVEELYQYVQDRVVQATPKQTPGKYIDVQRGQLVIAKSPPRVIPVKPKPLPEELTDALKSPLTNVRLGAVQELTELIDGTHPEYEAAALAVLEKLVEDDSTRVRNTAAQALEQRAARETTDTAITSSSKITGLLTRAQTAFDAGRYDDALASLNAVLALDAANAVAFELKQRAQSAIIEQKVRAEERARAEAAERQARETAERERAEREHTQHALEQAKAVQEPPTSVQAKPGPMGSRIALFVIAALLGTIALCIVGVFALQQGIFGARPTPTSRPVAVTQPTTSRATLEPTGLSPTSAPNTGTAKSKLNVRAEASTSAPVVGALPEDAQVLLVGRNADATWLQIEYPPGEDTTAWVIAEEIDTTADLSALPNMALASTIRVGVIDLPVRDGFNTATNFDVTLLPPYLADAIYDTLIELDPADESPVTGLAEAWEVSSDWSELTFHLRPGVKWHDGEPLTAADVVFTYNALTERSSPLIPIDQYAAIDKITAIDDLTVQVELKRLDEDIVAKFARFKILPEHLLEGKDLANLSSSDFIGTGALKVDSWTSDRVVFTANQDYWKGTPVIDHWVYDQIVGDPVAEAALKAGEIDALFSTYGFPPDYHDAEVSSRIGNFSPSKYAGSFWNLYQWYLK